MYGHISAEWDSSFTKKRLVKREDNGEHLEILSHENYSAFE